MTKVLMVRHGHVESDSPGRYWGQTDLPLSAEGLRQAEKLRLRLAKAKINGIYSSDLRRARDTAAIIAVPHRLPVLPCPELREINFGQLEGMTFGEIREHYLQAEKLWAGAAPELSFPGGEGLKTFTERIDRFAARLATDHPADTVLVVAHGGSLRVLICRMMGLHLSGWWQIRVNPASLSIVKTSTQGGVLCLLNDVSHLEGC